MSRKKMSCPEGSWFGIPLEDGGFALGLAARVSRRGLILGYLFGPRSDDLPLEADIQLLKPPHAILVGIFRHEGLGDKRWPILLIANKYSRDIWPMPKFARIDGIDGSCLRIEYSEDHLEEVSAVPIGLLEASMLPGDGVMGDIFVERKLNILLPIVDGIHLPKELAVETSGADILDNDVSSDVYGAFMEKFDQGRKTTVICAELEEEYADYLEDDDDMPSFWLGIAKAQWDCGQLQPRVHTRVSNLIKTEQGLEPWREAGVEALQERKQALTAFLAVLGERNLYPHKRGQNG